MLPKDTYVVYNTQVADVETVHPYYELAIKKLKKLCAASNLDDVCQQRYIILTLEAALSRYFNDNAESTYYH